MRLTYIELCACVMAAVPLDAQQVVDGIVDTAVDAGGSAVPGAAVTVRNGETNLEVKVSTAANSATACRILAAYTWSHTLDEQGKLGLFFEGNDPLNIHSSYGTSAYDRPQVTAALINPKFPLLPGVSANQAKLQGTTRINPRTPLVNSADFYVPAIFGGTYGVPLGDNVEAIFGNTSRNLFRSPLQKRLDLSVIQSTRIKERFTVRFQADAFNLTNTPSFDVPHNDLNLYSVRNGVPAIASIAK